MDAKKQRYTAEDLEVLIGDAKRVIAVKGKKRVELDLARDEPTAAELEAAMIGPTGNLRAPTVRVGKTLLVGFTEEAYDEHF